MNSPASATLVSSTCPAENVDDARVPQKEVGGLVAPGVRMRDFRSIGLLALLSSQ